MSSASDQSKYYVAQIKSTGNKTTTLVLGILFVLLLVWRGALSDLKLTIRDAITEKKKADILSVVSKNRLSKFENLRIKDTSYFAIAEGQKSPEYYKQQDLARKNYFAEIEKNLKLTKVFDFQRNKALYKFDTIKNKIKIQFDIPTLKPVSEKARIGTLLWLFILNISIYLIILSRKKIMSYLEQLYFSAIISDKMPVNDLYKLDLTLPIWISPIKFSRSDDKDSKNKNPLLRNINQTSNLLVSIPLLLAFTAMLVDVFILSWDLNTQIFADNFSSTFKITDILSVVVFLMQLIYWFFIKNTLFIKDFSQQNANEGSKSMSRKQFVLLSAPMLLFVCCIPAIGKKIPLIEPVILKRKKTRKNCIKQNPIKSPAPGFYINEKNIVHYISHNGICRSLKTLAPEYKNAFLKNLTFIDKFEFIEKNVKKIRVSFAYWAFSNEANHYIMLKNFDQAVKVLITGLELNRQNARTKTAFRNYCNFFISTHQKRINPSLKNELIQKIKNISINNASPKIL